MTRFAWPTPLRYPGAVAWDQLSDLDRDWGIAVLGEAEAIESAVAGHRGSAADSGVWAFNEGGLQLTLRFPAESMFSVAEVLIFNPQEVAIHAQWSGGDKRQNVLTRTNSELADAVREILDDWHVLFEGRARST